MHRDLKDIDVEEVLKRQLYGHLGCTLPDGEMYIVPITYAYHDGAVYGFSYSGVKIDALRKNPTACMQTEELLDEGMANSVIIWGTYEELVGQERLVAHQILFARLERAIGVPLSALYQPPPRALHSALTRATEAKESVFFRIIIQRKTGKFIQYD